MVGYRDLDTTYRNDGVLYNGGELPELFVVVGGKLLAIEPSTFRAAEVVSERATCDFDVLVDSKNEIRKGMPVTVRSEGDRIFRGFVNRALARGESYGGVLMEVDCVDYEVIADRKVVAEAYEAMTIGDIVRDLISTYLSDDGVTAGHIEDGMTVSEAIFNYVYLDRALDSMANETGFWWRIDGNRQLHFQSRSNNAAPWELDGINEWADRATLQERNERYRNRQFVRGGKGETNPLTERTVIGGTQRNVVTNLPVARVPTVTVDGTPVSMGIRGLEDEHEWYWNKGSNVISIDDAADDPTEGTEVVVTYRGLFDIVVITSSQAEIEERAETEGGSSGVWENVQTRPEITDSGAAFELAGGLLENFGRIGERLVFRTSKRGLRAGQLLTAHVPEWELFGEEFLIESVEWTFAATGLVAIVTSFSGPNEGTWTDYFKEMSREQDLLVFRENISEDQILVRVEGTESISGIEEELDTTVLTCEVPDDDLYTAARSGTYGDGTVGYNSASLAYRGNLTGEELWPC